MRSSTILVASLGFAAPSQLVTASPIQNDAVRRAYMSVEDRPVVVNTDHAALDYRQGEKARFVPRPSESHQQHVKNVMESAKNARNRADHALHFYDRPQSREHARDFYAHRLQAVPGYYSYLKKGSGSTGDGFQVPRPSRSSSVSIEAPKYGPYCNTTKTSPTRRSVKSFFHAIKDFDLREHQVPNWVDLNPWNKDIGWSRWSNSVRLPRPSYDPVSQEDVHDTEAFGNNTAPAHLKDTEHWMLPGSPEWNGEKTGNEPPGEDRSSGDDPRKMIPKKPKKKPEKRSADPGNKTNGNKTNDTKKNGTKMEVKTVSHLKKKPKDKWLVNNHTPAIFESYWPTDWKWDEIVATEQMYWIDMGTPNKPWTNEKHEWRDWIDWGENAPGFIKESECPGGYIHFVCYKEKPEG